MKLKTRDVSINRAVSFKKESFCRLANVLIPVHLGVLDTGMLKIQRKDKDECYIKQFQVMFLNPQEQ